MENNAGWHVFLKCPRQHVYEASMAGVRFNVDGHAVLPLPKVCPDCDAEKPPVKGASRWSTWREVRRAKKGLDRHLRDLLGG